MISGRGWGEGISGGLDIDVSSSAYFLQQLAVEGKWLKACRLGGRGKHAAERGGKRGVLSCDDLIFGMMV